MFIDARTKGTVLASYDLNGADRFFVCYTLDFGKIEIIGRGVKKPSSRLASHLEVFTVSDFLTILTAKNNILRSSVTVENFLNIRRNMDLYFNASYLLELVDKLTPFNDPEPRIFFLLCESLNALDRAKNKNDIEFIVTRFQFKFLGILGLRPRFDECIFCRKDLGAGEAFFSFRHGGAVCGNCRKKEDSGSLKLADKLSDALKAIFEIPFCADGGKKLFIKKEVIGNLRRIGSFLVMSHLGKEIKSETYINL